MFTDIDSYEAACKDQGVDPNKLPDYSGLELTDGEIRYNIAAFKLARIAKSLNKDEDGSEWVPEPGDDRWYPWMWWKKKPGSSGSGLSFDVTAYDSSLTFVASRLTYREEEIAQYAFETFKELYEDLIIFHP